MKGKDTTIQGAGAYVVESTRRDSRGAVLLVHEWWGLNDITKGWADQVAELGYSAVAVDLFDGKVTKDAKQAARFMEEADPKACREKLANALRWMKASDGLAATKIVTMGWCFGGGWSMHCALEHGTELAGAVIYYGQLETDAKKLEKCRVPLLGIFAEKDDWITIDSVRRFEKACQTARVPLELHVYDAGHAFSTPIHQNYDAGLAKDAWGVTTAFLRRVLG